MGRKYKRGFDVLQGGTALSVLDDGSTEHRTAQGSGEKQTLGGHSSSLKDFFFFLREGRLSECASE